MDKSELYKRFIELRAAAFTYDEICDKLKITKPTAIAWGKKFSSQIDETQNYLLVKTFGTEIKKRNDTFTLYFEQFRKLQANDIDPEIAKKGLARLIAKMNAIFGAKISNIQLTFVKYNVKEAVFTFAPGVDARDPSAEDIVMKTRGISDEKLLREGLKLINRINKRKEKYSD
ncbi:MAG: hypothetical protein ACYDA4_03775 [Ignavibacteriaceae bacterium]